MGFVSVHHPIESARRGWSLAAIPLLLSVMAASAQDLEPLLQGSEEGSAPERFAADEYSQDRAEMVRDQIRDRGVDDAAVLAAMGRVPRHQFVPPQLEGRAYEDGPLPIGRGQTISQPYIVAFMTELLELSPDDRVLEVGTGSAYQAAILAEIVDHVVSIEIIRPLAVSAAERLHSLGYGNVTVLAGDGYYGRSETAPYDAIIVTAAASHVPPPLTAQLKPGGHMAIPVGANAWTQNLLLVEKGLDGDITTHNVLPVRFVPLTGGH